MINNNYTYITLHYINVMIDVYETMIPLKVSHLEAINENNSSCVVSITLCHNVIYHETL